MWWGSGQDPGGSGGEAPSKDPPQNQQLLDIQEQFETQQTLIAQLKEMLKKSEQSNVSREKVEEYASTLSKMKERAARSKLKKSESVKSEDEPAARAENVKELSSKRTAVVTPAKEKVNLLRQQLEENRLKLAQRDKNQKGIEEMVNQLKAQLDDSQIMISQTTINLPKTEAKTVVVSTTYNTETPKEELILIMQNKDKQLEELNNRLQQLQGNIFDLQENLKEKDSVIEARTKAITLLSENLSKKGKNTLDMLDETKEQMRTMQEQFVNMEAKMKEENKNLQLELNKKNVEVELITKENQVLKEENSILHTRDETLTEQLAQSSSELSVAKSELDTTQLKIEELIKINQELETTALQLKTQRDESVEREQRSASNSPQRSKKSRNWRKSKKPIPESSQSEPTQSEHMSRITSLEKQVEEIKVDKERLLKKSKEENEEIESLKKQLDTMNKNMIKAKAQYKAKLKEMQKKVSPGDIKEKMIGLEADTVKLEQRVAELEEEKGNLQLRLVDVDSNKDKELIADLENKIEEQKMEIENHIRNITILETQITDKSTEISSLRTELAKLMHIENAQVCSEITSVQLEEQLDKELTQKKAIEDKYEQMKKENEELQEKIEEANKEKEVLNAKLVTYMQENMELIDRLEKSSAEKVSSAESIEIVESLTQQEKLEIEAYQKSLEFVPDKENIDQSDLDPNSELNENITKLTEDSSELLERINMFTVERREVMEKMDSLLSEKEHLLEKLNNLEKEKIELMNKFEALSVEKETAQRSEDKYDVTDGIRMDSASNTALIAEYKILVENQKIEINLLKEELLKITEENTNKPNNQSELIKLSKEKEGLELIITSLNEQFLIMHKEYQSFLKEHQILKETVKKNSEQIYEKDGTEKEFNVMKQRLTELEKKAIEDMEEIKALQEIIEDNKNELIKSADYISSLTNELSVKHSELASYQNEIEQFNSIVQQLNKEMEHKNISCENHVETINLLSSQLQELKVVINDNFNELQKYEELNSKIEETNQIIELKDTEIINLQKEKSIIENKMVALEGELKHKDENFKHIFEELKNKCLSLESQIQANTGSLDNIKGPFEEKIQKLEAECKKLEGKNKEQVDKMKKIAANLKKKVTACQELENKVKDISEKWETERKEKQNLSNEQVKNNSLIEQLKTELLQIQKEIENKDVAYGQLNILLETHTQQFENEKIVLQNKVSELESIKNLLQTEKTNCVEEIQKLNTHLSTITTESQKTKDSIVQDLLQQIDNLQSNFHTRSNAMEVKIQEKEMYIETLETENQTMKEKLAKLNESLLQVQERRYSLEQKAVKLGEELEAQQSRCEEVSQSENLLENRLADLIAHDEVIENKLKEMTATNQTLSEKVENLAESNFALQSKLSEAEIMLKEKENEHAKLIHLENDSVQFREVISNLEHDIKKLHLDYDKKLYKKNTEIEHLESELNNQIQGLNDLRKSTITKVEHFDNMARLNEDIEQLKQQLLNVKTDLDKQLHENEKLVEINSNYILMIDQLNAESSITYLQPDESDIQTLQLEVTNLQKIISEKDNDIQNYQRQNMQLQMNISNMSSFETQDDTATQKQLHDITNELKVSEEKGIELTSIITTLKSEIEEHKHTISKLQQELDHQKDLLVRKTAEYQIDEIICTAHQIITENKSTDPVEQELPIEQAIVKENQATVQSSPEQEQELLKKFKALEFLLYHVEKEKNEITQECNSLRNELNRSIYEKQCSIGEKSQETNQEVDLAQLEGQIITETDLTENVETRKQMRDLEYTPVRETKLPLDTTNTVQEEIIEPKSSYLCFKMEEGEEASDWNLDDPFAQVESNITPIDIQTTGAIPKKGKQSLPVEVTEPSTTLSVGDAFGGEDDGWGFNVEEVKLEEKHQMLTAVPFIPVQNLEDKLREKIHELESEKDKLLDELKAQQLKVVKLVKKAKDMKAKNDQLSLDLKQKQMGDLDMFMQDELNVQIKSLEDKLKEVNTERKKEQSEKENLLKRIDVLTAANERMIENKEKLDNEIQMLQFNNRQLTTKLDQLEWGSDSPQKMADVINIGKTPETDSKQEELTKKIQELNSVINDLTLDNEEMQMLLEEQRKLRLEAEKALSSVPIQENMKTEQEYFQLLNEKEKINNQFLITKEENKIINEKVNQYINHNNKLCSRLENIGDKLNVLIRENNLMKYQYTLDLETLQNENKHLQGQIKSIVLEAENTADHSKELLQTEVQTLTQQVTKLESDNSNLEMSLAAKQNNITELNTLIEQLKVDKLNLEIKLKEISGVISTENVDQLENLGERLEIIVKEVQNKNKEVKELNDILNLERAEFEQKLTVTLEQLAQEWSDRVEQRGSDVAESWKIHVDARENEFLQLEQALRMEITEIHNRNETLAIENNNLQKQIELLLQDKEAAASDNQIEKLQQILSEKQSDIISLTQKIQEVNTQFDVKNNEITTLQQIIETMKQQNEDLVTKNGTLNLSSQNHEKLYQDSLHVEQSLRGELTDITNKKEALVAENNELQKKIVLLEQEKQAAASDNQTEALQQVLSERQAEIISLSQQLQDITVQLEVKNNEIISLQQMIEALQKQNHDLIKTNEELHITAQQYEKSYSELTMQYTEIQKNIRHYEEQITKLKEDNKQLEILHKNIAELNEKLLNVEQELSTERINSSDLDNQVVYLQNTVQNQEHKFQELTQQISLLLNETPVFDGYDSLPILQQKIIQLCDKYQELINENLNLSNARNALEDVNNQINNSVEHYLQLNEKLTGELTDVHKKYEALEKESIEINKSKENAINQMNTEIQELESKYRNEISEKNLLYENLQKELAEYRTKEEINLANFEKQLLEKNEQVQQLQQEIQNKTQDIANIQEQLNANILKSERDISNLHTQLQTKIAEIYNLQAKINELNTLSTEEATQIEELRGFIEQQNKKIEELKQELERKNEDCNIALEELEHIQQLQQKQLHEKHVHFKEPLESKSESEEGVPTDPLRAELDLALYMLHQRDVRCEELTVELMQLLEERDTLQLRLSNAIRINEELRSKLGPQALDKVLSDEMNTPKVVQSTGAVPKRSSDIVLKATGTELATEATESASGVKTDAEEKQELDSKLSQLRSVGYRDKTLKDDQEIRYLQQMSIMQQHRDIAARLPPEAAAKLVDASYTLSRDVQSPSKVLLNWLWGKSTPKVNDI